MDALTGRIHLDFRSDDPIVNQIVQQFEALVHDGTFKPGDQLPTVREVAISLRINFSTVARAYRILDQRRLISTQRGRGTFIEERPDAGEHQPGVDDRSPPAAKELAERAHRFISQAYDMGFSPEQITQAVREQLDNLKSNHPTKLANNPGGN